jgi:tetratricopeptide (TPR) repeat protein
MKKESIVFSLAGMFFGVLVGWILGSQQAAPPPAAPPPQAAAPNAQQAAPTPPPVDVQRAAELERTANAQPSNAAPRIELANLYYDAERFDLATTWYEAALKISPKDVNASTDLGICYWYMNQADRALTQFDHSLAIDPKHVKTLLNQGIVLAVGKRDFRGAVEAWQKVVAFAPGSQEAEQAKQGLDGIASAHPEIKIDKGK